MTFVKRYSDSLIELGQKYLKTDIRYLLNGGFWLVFGQVASTLFSLGLSIAFAHYLSKEAFGTYKYVLSVAGLFGAFTLTGLSNAVIQTIARGNEGIVKYGYRISLKWSIFFVVGSLGVSGYYFLNNNILLAYSILFIGIFSPFLNSASIYSAYLQGRKDFRTNGLYSVIRGLLPALALFITVLFTNNPLVLIFVYFAANTTVITFLYQLTIKKFKAVEVSSDDQTIPFAKHSSVINVLAIIADKLDSILIFHYLGAVQVAIYTFAMAIPENINGMLKNLLPLAIARFSSGRRDHIKDSIFSKMFRLTGFLILISLAYILVAPYIFKFIFPKYMDAVFYTQIIGLSIIINGALPIAFFESQLAIKEKYILSIASNLVKIPLLFLGVIYFGIVGVIVAKLISKVFGLTLSLILVKRMR